MFKGRDFLRTREVLVQYSGGRVKIGFGHPTCLKYSGKIWSDDHHSLACSG